MCLKLRRTLVIALAILLASTALGALAVQAMSEAPRAVVMPETESGALQHFAAANALAAGWHEDATLIRVSATEGPQVDARVDPPFLWDTRGDALVGNGLALVWTFAYASPTSPSTTYWVSIGGDGSQLYARELTDPYSCCVTYVEAVPADSTASYSPSPEPYHRQIRAVSASIDAPAAVASLADLDAFASFADDHPVFMASVELVPMYDEDGDERSAWHVVYRTATHYGASAVVDADNGTVLHSGSWPQAWPICCDDPPRPPQPPHEPPTPCCRPEDFHATYSGSLDSWGYEVSFPVERASWVQEVRVTASLADGSPLGEAHELSIIDGNGRMLERIPLDAEATISLAAVPVSHMMTARVIRETGTPSLFGQAATPETYVTISIDVIYAEARQDRPTSWTFHGDAWPGAETWTDLWIESDEWPPLRPTTVTLTWDAERPAQPLELILLDAWGNEVESAKSDPLATGPQSLTLGVPETGEECCHTVLVRMPGSIGFEPVPYTLFVETIRPPHDDVREHDGYWR